VKSGLRCFPVVLFSVLLLALSPAALAGGDNYQLVTPNTYGAWPDCVGFVVMTLDGTENGCMPWPTELTPFPESPRYSAAADGSIAFMVDESTSGGQGSIWLAKPDGTAVELDSSIQDFDPTISYDGSKVVFARFDPKTWSSDIYSVNSDGSDLRLVVSGGGTNDLTLPSISPDGSTIAYWCGPARYATGAGTGCGPLTDGSYRIWGVMRANIDGTDPRMIVIGAGDAIEPGGPNGLSWSPDGKWLAVDGALTVYVDGGQSGQEQIFEYHTDGSDLFANADPTRQITHEAYPSEAIYPQFSPDGSKLLYVKTGDASGTYMIGVDGTDRRELPIPHGEFIPTAAPVPPPPLVDATHVAVPSVHSLRVAAARSRLAANHLRVGKVRHVFSAKVRKNRVLSQRPRAGAVAHRTQKLGPRVNLVVSRGRRPRH
jgi:PASTA domain/WD40-like Beta Propeller Repeat